MTHIFQLKIQKKAFLTIRDKTSRTESDLSTWSPVVGQIPPLARVAAITDTLSQSTSIEQHLEVKQERYQKSASLSEKSICVQ